MHIRLAQIEDLLQIVLLGRSLLDLHKEYDNDYYQLEENFDELFGNWVRGQLNNLSQFIIVAQNPTDNKISGFISGFVKALFPWFKTKSVGHISYLIIDEAYQKQGIGKLLEDAARNWFVEKNIHFLELYVDEKNEIGQRVWNSYGFLPFKKFLRKKI